MAYYASLVSLVQLLEEIIHRDRYPNLLLDKQQIASVYEKFSLLQQLLDDYSAKDREAADFLERRIRDAAYRAQDIIESHISDQVYQKDTTYGVKRVLWHLISALQKTVLGRLQPQRWEELRLNNAEREYQELEKVKEEVDSIVKLMRIKKSPATEDLRLNYYSADAGTSKQAPSPGNTMVGVEERMMITIKDQLCGEPSKRQIVSIVGMGGIGKTTVIRHIFDYEHIANMFDRRAWVTVSQDYHQHKVLLDILDGLNETASRSSGVGELGERIYKHLKERRYLIVLDDVWNTEVWDDLKWILPDDSNGSRIVITTRISDVASYANTGFSHQMQFINEDQSWNLFCAKVVCPPELEDIGRFISKNCRGLPLAIVVVAGLLSEVDKKRYVWEEIARNLSSTAAENNEHFSNLLSLSYNHLPHHLKPCFLHIGGFPEDYEIPVSKLVKLWIAEGFLKPVGAKSLEAVAEEYLENLVNRNLVLIMKKRSNGKIKSCGIHDVLRDLCIERVHHENFFHVLDTDDYFHPIAARNVRRIYVHPTRSVFIEAEECGQRVRCIIRFSHDWNFLSFGSGFKLLRVLDAVQIMLFSFPDEILELFHLRYLALSNHVLPIPPSISLLQNLQTLILVSWDGFGEYFSLPSQIWKMPNLMHIIVCQLELSWLSDKRIVDEPLVQENLQTLTWVRNVRFTKEAVEMIPNLRKLKLLYYENRGVWQKFGLANLCHFRQLETLYISFPNWDMIPTGLPLPESFAFPSVLKKLSLRGCRLSWTDMTVVGSLPNLQILKLRREAFVGEKWKSVDGEFLQLKFLLMENLELKYWKAENTVFPALQHLKISNCRRLQKIPPEIGEIPTLELVEVDDSGGAAKSAIKMQEEQQNLGNDVLQFRVHHRYNYLREEDASESEEEIQEEVGSDSKEDEMQKEEVGSESKEEEIQEEKGSDSKEKEIQEEKGSDSKEEEMQKEEKGSDSKEKEIQEEKGSDSKEEEMQKEVGSESKEEEIQEGKGSDSKEEEIQEEKDSDSKEKEIQEEKGSDNM